MRSLDSGTTTTAIARALRRFLHLTTVANALNIAASSVTQTSTLSSLEELKEELFLSWGTASGGCV
jgi:DeoR/GlpR family transcriptional regulator of sugar metabolism